MEFVNKKPKIYVLSGKAGSGKTLLSTMIEDIYFKKGKKSISLAYASYLKEYAKNVLGWDGNEDTKPREFLQQVGVELIKTHIDEHMLVNRVVEDVKVYSYFYDVIIITDARFEDEINYIKDNFENVSVIRVEGKRERGLTKDQKEHKTETGLDNFSKYDYVIENDGTVYDLRKKIEKIIGD